MSAIEQCLKRTQLICITMTNNNAVATNCLHFISIIDYCIWYSYWSISMWNKISLVLQIFCFPACLNYYRSVYACVYDKGFIYIGSLFCFDDFYTSEVKTKSTDVHGFLTYVGINVNKIKSKQIIVMYNHHKKVSEQL